MRNRINFANLVDQYGPPKAVSNNGQIYIFRQKEKQDFHICQLTNNGFELVKSFNIVDSIRDYIENNRDKYEVSKSEDDYASRF